MNTAMEAIDKVRDTSTSHERCSIIEVMGRNAGYLAMWCGIANGAEDVLIPEKYDYDEQKLINNIIASRKAGKKHHIIINAEGIGHPKPWRNVLRRLRESRPAQPYWDTCSVAEVLPARTVYTRP